MLNLQSDVLEFFKGSESEGNVHYHEEVERCHSGATHGDGKCSGMLWLAV